mmetsp:Transcript_7587/g.12889  ORF Transcript_7587/g.12889 Transcript_7587/m.12889 type:complete len:299 (-) Transcript_7587:342-1238(-)
MCFPVFRFLFNRKTRVCSTPGGVTVDDDSFSFSLVPFSLSEEDCAAGFNVSFNAFGFDASAFLKFTPSCCCIFFLGSSRDPAERDGLGRVFPAVLIDSTFCLDILRTEPSFEGFAKRSFAEIGLDGSCCSGTSTACWKIFFVAEPSSHNGSNDELRAFFELEFLLCSIFDSWGADLERNVNVSRVRLFDAGLGLSFAATLGLSLSCGGGAGIACVSDIASFFSLDSRGGLGSVGFTATEVFAVTTGSCRGWQCVSPSSTKIHGCSQASFTLILFFASFSNNRRTKLRASEDISFHWSS